VCLDSVAGTAGGGRAAAEYREQKRVRVVASLCLAIWSDLLEIVFLMGCSGALGEGFAMWLGGFKRWSQDKEHQVRKACEVFVICTFKIVFLSLDIKGL
jgi:hypothetical protein